MLSYTEENYLKALYHLMVEKDTKPEAGTNELAAYLGVKPATVNDMLKKLKDKKLITHERYGKIRLQTSGRKLAIEIVRKHRLWETFLYEKLDFNWHEVHDVAEQLEHIQSPKLIEKLDAFLNYPSFDPHGDPIPDKDGNMPKSQRRPLSKSVEGCRVVILGVSEHSELFLNYLSDNHIGLNDKFTVERITPFDETMRLSSKKNPDILVSNKAANKIQVTCLRSDCGCGKM
ncbi:MAG: metal-dependent transcriptional regulator [Sediminibacterium sp.]|nr:metal-dependent transcriptional regulator [Sediminibacterium sp.]